MKIKNQNLKSFRTILLLLSFTLYTLAFTIYTSFAQHEHQTAPAQKEAQTIQKKIKYWTCGMHPQIKQDKPGNCPICNMKLIPVYEEVVPIEEKGMVKLSPREISLAGVKSEPVTFRYLFKEIRTVGRIAYDSELYKVEEEFIQAVKAKRELEKSQIPEIKERTIALVEAARLKLRLQGLSEEQVNELSKQDQPDRSLIISDEISPYVWVYADIYEYELSWIKINQPVKVISVSFPQEEFNGTIVAIDPVLNPMTRSVRIRAKLNNPELKLKPEMYVEVHILADLGEGKKEVLAIPRDTVLDTGLRKVVWVDLGEGRFQSRDVVVGPEAVSLIEGEKERFYPVIKGLNEGEQVVAQANFLIDSQSQIAGPAEAIYGGALVTGEEKEKTAPAHKH